MAAGTGRSTRTGGTNKNYYQSQYNQRYYNNQRNRQNLKTNNKNKINKIKVKKAGNALKSFLLAVLVLALVIAALWFLVLRYYCIIDNITISENNKYSYDEILKASGINIGDELYSIDINKTKENISKMLTYSENVKITRVFPSTLNIDITTENGVLGIMLGGDYYVISKNFRVIDKIKVVGTGLSESDFKPPEGVITFKTDSIKRCYIGEQIEFSDEDIYNFLKEITELIESDNKNTGENDILSMSMISGIDITNKYKVVMNYGDKFLVKYGIFENITPRVINSFEIIKNLPDYAEGVIDLTDVKPASFKYDENVAELYKSGTNKRS